MGNLLRRRMMMQNGGGEETWDYEWVSHDDGLPSDNGWTLEQSGNTNVALTDYYTMMRVGGTSSYVSYSYPQTYPSGVMEVKAKLGATMNAVLRLTLSNGTNGVGVRIQYSSGYKGIYLMNNPKIANMIKLQDATLDTLYTIRFVLKNGYGDVYVNGDLLAANIDLATMLGVGTATKMQGGANSSTVVPTYLREVRMKFGRV